MVKITKRNEMVEKFTVVNVTVKSGSDKVSPKKKANESK